MNRKPRVHKTPNGWHAYTATLKGEATYGWGNTPSEARAKLAENLERIAAERDAPTEAVAKALGYASLADYHKATVHPLSRATEPTEQGSQYIIPGCEKDKTRGPKQMELF